MGPHNLFASMEIDSVALVSEWLRSDLLTLNDINQIRSTVVVLLVARLAFLRANFRNLALFQVSWPKKI